MAGSKRQTRDGVYELRVSLGKDPATGKYRTVSRTHHGTGTTADRALARLVTEVDDGKHSGTKGTVDYLMDAWIEQLERKGRATTTIRGYRSCLHANILPRLGHIQLRKLTAKDLDDLYQHLAAKGLDSGSIHQHHSVMSGALRQAEKWGWVTSNVARLASPPEVRHAPVESPPIGDVRRLLDAAEKKNVDLAVLLFVATTTGARRGELAGVRWRNVDLANGELTIEKSIYDMKRQRDLNGLVLPGPQTGEKDTKTHRSRHFAIDQVTVAVLGAHFARMRLERADVGPASFVWSQAGDCSEPYKPDRITGFFRRLRDAEGLGSINLNHLRHFSATNLIAAGFDIRTVAGRHGHNPAVMLNTYAHVMAVADRQAADFMGQLELRPGDGPSDTPG